jgi:hypothetical protein
LEDGCQNRPREKVHTREFLISDEMDRLLFPARDVSKFRPENGISVVQHLCADGFCRVSYTQGGVSDRSSRNYTLGYYILAFQTGKIYMP